MLRAPTDREGTMHPQLDVNHFELWGKGIHVSYSTTSLDGRQRFHYQAYGTEKSFAGDEIRVAESELGRTVTVTVSQVPDLRTETFSILIPAINMFAGDTQVKFTSVGIHTTHHTSIGGPHLVKGALASYDGVDLVGVARHIVT
jgi:hypothetical protein